ARLGHLDGVRWLLPGGDIQSWYPNRFSDPVESNEPFLSQAIQRCDAALDEASENGRLGPERLAIVGFSQGACIAAEYAWRYPQKCGSVIVFTGALMGPPGSHPRRPTPSLKGVRVLITGSNADEWISEESTRESARTLEEMGADVTLRVYDGRPHIVNDEEL